MQPASRETGWQSFVSLSWYAGVISFLFRFLAMTSEPLLALGVILSAADFLQQGHLMSHNPQLVSAWSWAQAISIEASTGPTLAFSLDAFRAGDKLKGRLYATLAALLFLVGGAMLFLQLISNTTGMSEAAVTSWVLYPLLALRVLVASGIVALLCSKHLRFSSQVADAPPVQAVPPVDIPPNFDEVIEKLDARYNARMEALYQKTVETVKITIEQATNPMLPAVNPAQLAIRAPAREEAPDAQTGLENLVEICDKDEQPQPIFIGRFASKEQAIIRTLQHSPHLSDMDLAQICGCHIKTAAKWAARYRKGLTA